MKKTIILGLIILSLFFLGCSNTEVKTIGGERDEHGCLGPAGYQWCPSEQKCMRMWVEYCEEFKDQFRLRSFDDCAKAGNPIMQSHPRKCRAGGKTFIEELNQN